MSKDSKFPRYTKKPNKFDDHMMAKIACFYIYHVETVKLLPTIQNNKESCDPQRLVHYVGVGTTASSSSISMIWGEFYVCPSRGALMTSSMQSLYTLLSIFVSMNLDSSLICFNGAMPTLSDSISSYKFFVSLPLSINTFPIINLLEWYKAIEWLYRDILP